MRAPGIVDGRFLAEQVINVQYEVVQFEPSEVSFGALPKTSVRGVSDTAICCWVAGGMVLTTLLLCHANT